MSEAEGALARALELGGYGEITGDLDQYQEWGGTPNEVAGKVLAALSADGWMVERERLDVERLTAALVAEHAAYIEQPESFESHHDIAAFVAREYAALRGGPDATD